jgi:hypothetical protein
MKTTKARKPATDADTMRPEYDFSNAVRGVTAARYAQGTNIVLLDPDVAQLFPDSRAVNEGLRTLARPRLASRKGTAQTDGITSRRTRQPRAVAG